MARIDDYIHAKKIAGEILATQPFDILAAKSGFEITAQSVFKIPFLDRVYQLSYPAFDFKDDSEPNKLIPLQEQVLILHYMQGNMRPETGKWIAYREIPGASFYFSAFVKRAIDPLKKVFGNNVAGLLKAAEKLNGSRIDAGDAGFEFKLFPKVSLRLILWTGTITLGNRQASALIPAPGVTAQSLADAAQLSSLADETPEGRSIVVLAKRDFGIRGRELVDTRHAFVPFSARTRMSGIDLGNKQIRKGAVDAIDRFVQSKGGVVPPAITQRAQAIAMEGGTPLLVAENDRVLGVVHLKDIIKHGIKERFARLRAMGVKTVMITGDNPNTAASIAAEAGVDDFLAEATPEAKLNLIREYQKGGRLVAMTGDGTNDAPALAQADVAVAMNAGTQAAKEAGNMVDLESNPTKLLDVVQIGKQMLITRGTLTTFSVANDVAKYFAILPSMFIGTFPALGAMNIMGLDPDTAILSAVIFNALIIVALIPLALKGVAYKAMSAVRLLRRNLLVYGIGGLIAPFAGIKAIDLLVGVLK